MQNKNYTNFRDERTDDEIIAVGVPIDMPQGHPPTYFQQPLNPYMPNGQQNHNQMPMYAMNQPNVMPVNQNMAMPQQ